MCAHLIWGICRPLFRQRCIIPHYSLTHSLAASLPSSLYSSNLSLSLSLPPSLSHWPLPACWPQGKLPQFRNAVLLHCNTPLCPASLHPYSTHIWTHTHTYTVDVRSHTSMHAHKNNPAYTQRLYTPSPPLELPLYQPLLRLFLLAIVLPP